jgi:hypothetical protein
LRYALEELDVLITVTLKPELIREKSITGDQKQEWILAAEKNKENIRIFLMRKAFDIAQEKALELLIQQYQLSIITLLDKVFNYQRENIFPELHHFYNVVLKLLEDILSNIEQRYAKYFNQDDKVPDIYLQLSMEEIRHKLKQISRRFKDNKNNEKLIALSLSCIHSFSISKSNKIITYRRLMYIKDIISGMELQCRQVNFTDKEMMELLIYKNFNCSSFISFCINEIVNKINSIPEHNDKIDQLGYSLKQINQMQVKPCFAFKHNNESVKEQVATWINEEIFYFEQKHRLLSVVPLLKDDAIIIEEHKLHLSVSVDVLTLLARSAKDSKLILNKQMTGMFRNISRFCRTKNAENPSATSMLNKSYVAERSNKKAAIDILHEMIKNINRYCIVPLLISYNFLDEIMDILF